MADSAATDNNAEELKGQSNLTLKGRQSREALLKAAMVVFSRDGFITARIADIASEAGMAHGSFYTYFSSKEEIFSEVINAIRIDMVPPAETRSSSDDPYEMVLLTNQQYVAVYRRNVGLMATFEQVSTFSPEIRQYRAEIRHRYVERNSRAIKRWQAEGLADANIDADYAAIALGAMVDRFVYIWLVLGEDIDESVAVETMTRLWIQGIGLKVPTQQRSLSRSAKHDAAPGAAGTGGSPGQASPRKRPVRKLQTAAPAKRRVSASQTKAAVDGK